MKIKLPSSVYNWISISGAVISIISLFMIVFLFSVSFFLDRGGSYLGLVIYLILPAFLVAGLILIPIGMLKFIKSSSIKERKLPSIDLNLIAHRNAFFIFISVTTIFLFISALGSYEAFHYTESNEFCGTVCHSVMQPEYTAYQNSSHAKVKCVACHVGTGANWFVKSKLSGLYQVYAVIANNYSKPISTPIKNLRPARETCEECHWPQKFYPRKIRTLQHYLSDENNTEWNISLLMKVGPLSNAAGLSEGIHWHIDPNNKIEFISLDDNEQEIPWVRYTNLRTNDIKIFTNEDYELTNGKLDSLKIRTMDCIDCHNRPSHVYNTPTKFVNKLLSNGRISKNLPNIKKLSMDICATEFSSTDSAMIYIKHSLNEYYNENVLFAKNNSKSIENAIINLQEEYKKNIFPEMSVNWNAYPNNIGHLEFNGCFRCHTDEHVDEQDEVISKDCNLCHTILSQGNPDNLELASFNEALEFIHPEDIEEEWKEGVCIDCHTGLNP